MGEHNDATPIPEIVTGFTEAFSAFEKLKEELNEELSKRIPVVEETLALMDDALEIVKKIYTKDSTLPIQSADYYQVILSLTKYKSVALSYDKNSATKQRDQLYQISGHIVDRISQKVLESAGRDTLKNYYEKLSLNIQKLDTVATLLSSSANNLNDYLNDKVVDTLHGEYFLDHQNYSKVSSRWFLYFFTSVILFVILLTYSIFTLPTFIEYFIMGKEIKDISIVLLYALTPRITLAVLFIFIIVSFWRNYQSYKHLEISAKNKLNVAKLLPIMRMNTEDSKEFSTLQFEFIRQMSKYEESGFSHQSRQATSMEDIAGRFTK